MPRRRRARARASLRDRSPRSPPSTRASPRPPSSRIERSFLVTPPPRDANLFALERRDDRREHRRTHGGRREQRVDHAADARAVGAVPETHALDVFGERLFDGAGLDGPVVAHKPNPSRYAGFTVSSSTNATAKTLIAQSVARPIRAAAP